MKNKWIIILIAAAILIVVLVFSLNPPESAETRNVDSLPLDGEYQTVQENINYHGDSLGYLARPEESGNYPGVIMIHEWWGLNDNIKQMADNLASEGYVVLAVDLYNGEVAETPEEARGLSSSVRENPEMAIENMRSALQYLENQGVDKVASLGWCFGGQQSLQISLAEPDEIDATIVYYGNLVTDKNELSAIDQPVLGVFGSEDTSIPVETVNEFDSALDELDIENEIYIYDGVGHAFANPSGMNYAPDETEDAWEKTLSFLERNLKD